MAADDFRNVDRPSGGRMTSIAPWALQRSSRH
jgi:hypothetical protein